MKTTEKMRLKVTQLWDTRRLILVNETGEGGPSCPADLKKYDNVIYDEYLPGPKLHSIMLNDAIEEVYFSTVHHPADGSPLTICELF